MQRKQFVHAIGLAVAGLVAGAGAAHAQLTQADVGVNPTFEQTGPTTVTSTGKLVGPAAKRSRSLPPERSSPSTRCNRLLGFHEVLRHAMPRS